MQVAVLNKKERGPEYFPCWFSGIKNHTINIVVYESVKGIRKFFFNNFNLQIRRFGRHAEFEGGWSGVLSGLIQKIPGAAFPSALPGTIHSTVLASFRRRSNCS